MRKLLWLPVLAALGWSAYWVFGAQELRGDVTGWLADRRDEGWQAEAADTSVSGYPLRFETRVSELSLADPDSGLAWSAPIFSLSQAAWQPRSVTVIWPDSHVLRTPQETLTLRNDALTLDLVTRAGPDLPFERVALRADTLTVEQSGGAITSLGDLAADVVRGTGTRYDMTVLARGVVISNPMRRGLSDDLPQSLERAQLDMSVDFDRPWDMRAIDTARPQPTALDLRLLEATWGPMALRMTAALDIDADGIPSGTVAVQAQNWRDMLAVATQAGAVPPALARPLEEGLRFLAGLTGNRDALDVQLRLERGQVFVGIFPVGPAPRLRLR